LTKRTIKEYYITKFVYIINMKPSRSPPRRVIYSILQMVWWRLRVYYIPSFGLLQVYRGSNFDFRAKLR